MDTTTPQIKVKLLDIVALHKDTPQDKLEVLFTGTMLQAHEFCANRMEAVFKGDPSMLFGGYYADPKTGTCYLLDL